MAKKHKAHKEHKKEVHHREETSMYFRMDYPLEVRKEILKSAINVTQLLKRYEGYKALVHLRAEVYKDFMKSFNDIESLSRKLASKDLPVIDRVRNEVKKARATEQKALDSLKNIEVARTTNKPEPIIQEAKIQKRLTEEERLDEELRLIQDRLRKLDNS